VTAFLKWATNRAHDLVTALERPLPHHQRMAEKLTVATRKAGLYHLLTTRKIGKDLSGIIGKIRPLPAKFSRLQQQTGKPELEQAKQHAEQLILRA